VSVSYKSNKGIRLTKQYFVLPLAKKWGVKNFFGSLRSQNCPPTFKTVAPPLCRPVCFCSRTLSVYASIAIGLTVIHQIGSWGRERFQNVEIIHWNSRYDDRC